MRAVRKDWFTEEEDEESPLSLLEQSVSWVFDDWQEAVAEDDYNLWHGIYLMLYGAMQSTVWSTDYNRFEKDSIYRLLQGIAHNRAIASLKEAA